MTELEIIRQWWKDGANRGRFMVLYRVNHRAALRVVPAGERATDGVFIGLAQSPGNKKPEFWLHGGNHPTTYKTLRNARRAAGKDGVVLMFDLSLMPVVALEGVVEDEHDGNELDEYMFAERQVDMWARRAAELKART